ncbi:MAG: flagellar basal body-associated FliL family protein [Proteobacteria bacterium]|nr:flagellar basal body-associated FliL family protein [Pseudomonadota bacterium]
MLFIVPDEPDETLAPGTESASLDPGAARKAQLDDSETTKSTKKVDLDLDDAPFLEEEEEEEELLEEEEFQLPSATSAPKEKKELPAILKNKFLYIGLFAMLLLGGAAFFLLSGDSTQPPVAQAPAPEEPVAPEVVAEEAPAVEPAPGETLIKLDPFLIEQHDAADTLRFLEISLVYSTTNPSLADNLVRETPTVRYALFYYMKSKDLAFLTDQANVDNLKLELLNVTNQYMVQGEFETLLFEQYLVK